MSKRIYQAPIVPKEYRSVLDAGWVASQIVYRDAPRALKSMSTAIGKIPATFTGIERGSFPGQRVVKFTKNGIDYRYLLWVENRP